MKQAKRIALILLSVLCLLAMLGCHYDGYRREQYYGVVRFSSEVGRLVVYIPDVGEVEIPQSEHCYAGFDGYGENENDAYVLKDGDFVSIGFKYKRSFDDHGVKIEGVYPARFDRSANTIEALWENITFEKADGGYRFSFVDAEAERFREGDAIYFVSHGGENGRAFRRLVADGTVTEITGQRITVYLKALKSETDFFKNLPSVTAEREWN